MARLMRSTGILILGLLISSCTRSVEKAESVRLDLSSFTKSGLNAQSTSTLEINFIAVNVTVDGVLKASCKLDPEISNFWSGGCLAHPDFPGDPTAGVEFPDVPIGSALIQVLLVGEEPESSTGGASSTNEEGGGEVFKYGEGTAALSNGNNPVMITVKAAETTEDREGFVAGRYGSTYTGRVALQYVPDSGNPMTVFYLDMFAGWFEIFLLDGVPLQYKLVDDPEGRTLFGGKVAIDSPQWHGGESSILNFSHETVYFSDGDSQGGEFGALGYWTEDGVPDTSSSVCRDNTAVFSDHQYTDMYGVNTLSWPNDFAVSGGSGTCTLAFPLVDSSLMRIGGDLILNSDGGDNPLFRGPFRTFLTPQGEPDLMYSYASGTELTVQWQYLPDVGAASELKGVSVFYSNTYAGDISREFEGAEGLNCHRLEVDPQFAGHFERHDVFGSVESVTFDAGIEMANKGIVLACPRRSDEELGRDRYFNTAIGGGVYRAPATQLKIQGLAGTPYPHINQNVCTALEIVGLDDNDLKGELNSDDGYYTVSLSAAQGNFYGSDPSCVSFDNTLNLENGYDFIYYKSTITGPAGIGVHTHPSESNILSSGYMNVNVTTISAADGMLLYGLDDIWSTQCIPYLFAIVDADLVPTTYGSDFDVTLTSDQAGGTFWADYDSYCQSSSFNSSTVYSGGSYGVLNYKPGGVVSGSITVAISTSQGELSNEDTFEVEVSRPPNASYMRLETMGPYYGSSTCHSMHITTYIPGDGGQSPKVYPENTMTYNMSASGPGTMTFYTDSGCTTATSSFSQSSTQAEVPVYFKVDSTGSYSVNALEPNVGGEFNFNTNISVSP